MVGSEVVSQERVSASVSDGVVEVELIERRSEGGTFTCPDRPSYATCAAPGSGRGVELFVRIVNRGRRPVVLRCSDGVAAEVFCRNTVFRLALAIPGCSSITIPPGGVYTVPQPLFYEERGGVYTLEASELCRGVCIALLTISYSYAGGDRSLQVWLGCALGRGPVGQS